MEAWKSEGLIAFFSLALPPARTLITEVDKDQKGYLLPLEGLPLGILPFWFLFAGAMKCGSLDG